MKILVTGAQGQLGRYVQQAAIGSEDHYLFTDREELDITDRAAVARFVQAEAVDVILNCAAYTDVERAEEQEREAYRLNAEAVGYLASAARENDALLIHISTDYVFMGGCCALLTEQSHPQPINAYGRTKLAGEELIAQSGCHFQIIRTAWLYGAYGKNFVRTILRRSLEQSKLRVVNDQIGSPTFAGDLAEAIVSNITARNFTEGIFHYTNLGECSWWEFAVEICRLAGRTTTVEPCRSEEYPSRAKRPANTILSKDKFIRTFQRPISHWRDSLKKMIDAL